MALSELEQTRVAELVGAFIEARRPAPHIRSQLDLAFRIHGQSIEIFAIRPVGQGTPHGTMEQSIAKATFNKTLVFWKVFWKRSDLKWHAYTPMPHVGTIEKFLALVAEDKHACFFG